MRIVLEAKVPKSIKQQIIKQWLQVTSRDQIAKDNGIGAGTVSSIKKKVNKTFLILGQKKHKKTKQVK